MLEETPNKLSRTGKKNYAANKYAEAAENFAGAATGYLAQDLPLNSAEMLNNQSVALLQAGEAQAAYDVVLGTDQTFAEAGDIKRQAMAVGNTAAALEGLVRLEEAEKAYLQSAALFAEVDEDELRANVMQSISKLQLGSGRQLEAIASMQTGLENIKKPSIKQKILKKLLKSPFKLLDR